MNADARIYVTGHRGLIGSAILRLLKRLEFTNVITTARDGEYPVDFRNWEQTRWAFSVYRPEYVFHCAARVGGLAANAADPLGFFLDNMHMEMNVFRAAAEMGTRKVVFLGSSCAYPTTAEKPLRESSLLTGPFQPEVEAYGLAKAAGVRLCEWYHREHLCNYIAALPCNIYGVNDHLDPGKSHVVPGLLCRMHRAIKTKTPMKVWGSGVARRELLFSDDLAEALLLVMQKYDRPEPINTGSGQEVSIAELAELCRQITGYPWKLEFDPHAVVGTPNKCMDNSKLFGLGWTPRTPLLEGLKAAYSDISRRLDNLG